MSFIYTWMPDETTDYSSMRTSKVNFTTKTLQGNNVNIVIKSNGYTKDEEKEYHDHQGNAKLYIF